MDHRERNFVIKHGVLSFSIFLFLSLISAPVCRLESPLEVTFTSGSSTDLPALFFDTVISPANLFPISTRLTHLTRLERFGFAPFTNFIC